MIREAKIIVICLSVLIAASACSSPEGKTEAKIADDGITGIQPPEGCEIIENMEDFEPVSEDQSFNEETDVRTSAYFPNIAIAGEALYLIDSSLIIYHDKNTGNSNVLCGKPDCDHLSGDCNGRVVNSGKAIQYYNGDLYVVVDFYRLYKVSLDGNVREDLGLLTTSELLGGTIRWVIHRGYIYYCYASGTEVGSEGTYYINNSNCIFRKALDNDSEPECIMALPVSEYQATYNIMGVGSYIYITIESTGIYRYNTESNKIEWFKELGNGIHGSAFLDNKIYYAQYDENEENTIIYCYNIESNEKDIFYESEKEISISYWDKDFFYINSNDNRGKTEVINHQGEVVAELPSWEEADDNTPECETKSRLWAITDDDRIYIWSEIFLYSSDDNIYTPGSGNAYGIIEYIEKEDILDGEYEIKEWSEIADKH